MKVSYNWLKEHIALPHSATELAEHLHMLGLVVDSIERRGPAFSGVVTAEILEIGKHPNADRLSLCKVTDGAQTLAVVCGAKNIAVGQRVPLARLGAKLPGGREITPAKIRGVESQGMLCSGAELGLGNGHDGILVLEPGTPVGQDFSKSSGEPDDILEVDVTPNRGDCLSHFGLARELSAYFGIPLKSRPAPALPAPSGDCPEIRIEAAGACLRYVGRVLSGVKVGPSPGWLAARLESIGLRPINNVVDVTNFILFDLGQPLHAFDLDKLAGGITVRVAREGERIVALDGKEHALSPRNLVIADAKAPVAIAGVMGGQESAVTAKTTRILLESAAFDPAAVRRSGQQLRLRSDSSYRFERGVDPAGCERASARAAALLLELCGKDAALSAPRGAGTGAAARRPIAVPAGAIGRILGRELETEKVSGVLRAIGNEVRGSGALEVTPPSWRPDLETRWDLAEEVGRMLSYESIPARAAPVPARPAELTALATAAERCRERLTGLGLDEAYNFDFLSEAQLARARIPSAELPRLANPVSDEWSILRPSLLPGLLQNAATNLNRGAASVRLFEIGTAYARSGRAVSERRRLAAILLGPVAEPFWKPERVPPASFYDLKGILLQLLPGLQWKPFSAASDVADPVFNASSSARLFCPKGPLGTAGLLHPTVARAWELERENPVIFELDVDLLSSWTPPRAAFAPFGLFPPVKRDLSILVADERRYAEIESVIFEAAGSELARLELRDVFSGKGVPAGKHSLTLRLLFSRPDRTLTDAEVGGVMERLIAALKARAGAELRS